MTDKYSFVQALDSANATPVHPSRRQGHGENRIYRWDWVHSQPELLEQLEDLYGKCDAITGRCLFTWAVRDALGDSFTAPNPAVRGASDVLKSAESPVANKQTSAKLVYYCLVDSNKQGQWLDTNKDNVFREKQWCSDFYDEMSSKRRLEHDLVRKRLRILREAADRAARQEEEQLKAKEALGIPRPDPVRQTLPVEPVERTQPQPVPSGYDRDDDGEDANELYGSAERHIASRNDELRALDAAHEAVKHDRLNLRHQINSVKFYCGMMVISFLLMAATVIWHQEGWALLFQGILIVPLVSTSYLCVHFTNLWGIMLLAVATFATSVCYVVYTTLKWTLYNTNSEAPLNLFARLLILAFAVALAMLGCHLITLSVINSRALAIDKARVVGDPGVRTKKGQ